MKLSVSLVSFNEEANLRRTLEPILHLADEIVIVDSFSTDKTCDIAREMGAKVYQEPWAGFIGQKNSCLAKCSGEWILFLDCDEVCDPTLVGALERLLASRVSGGAYLLNRRTFYMGRLLKRAWQPDNQLRFVHRSANPRWTGNEPHGYLGVDGEISGKLPGDLVHYSYTDFAHHMARTQVQAAQIAKTYFEKGRKARMADLVFRPPLVFLKRMLLQGAFLDGAPGVIAAASSAVYSYMKYSFLLEMQKKSSRAEQRGK